MATPFRTRWQDFKRKYPKFEKSKNFKADVGPQLEKFDKAFTAETFAGEAYMDRLSEVKDAVLLVSATMGQYSVVVDELENTEPAYKGKIKADFTKFYTLIQDLKSDIASRVSHAPRIAREINTNKIWQDFKKKYPTFEKSKNFKTDVGPEMGKFDKSFMTSFVARKAVLDRMHEILAVAVPLLSAMDRYGVVVDQLEKEEPAYKGKIKADFLKLYNEVKEIKTEFDDSIKRT